MSDVTVVGGGPAGCAAAIELAEAGTHVQLYEKEQFPRPKLCGGFLSPESLPVLKRLGVLDGVRKRAWPVHRVRVVSSHGAEAESSFSSEGLSLARADLDLLLLNRARDAGVTVFEGKDGMAALRSGVWSVIASGRSEGPSHGDRREERLRTSAFDRFSHRPGVYYGFQAGFAGVEGVTDQVELDLFAGGYVGLARQSADRVNVCGLTTYRELKRLGPSLDHALQVFCWRHPMLLRHLASATRETPWKAVGPVRMGVRMLATSRRLYVGDAACVVDPFVGEGITIALQSGRLAARAFQNRGLSLEQTYTTLWKEAFEETLPLGNFLRGTLGNVFFQEVLVSGLSRYPKALDWLTRRTRSHTTPPHDYLHPATRAV